MEADEVSLVHSTFWTANKNTKATDRYRLTTKFLATAWQVE